MPSRLFACTSFLRDFAYVLVHPTDNHFQGDVYAKVIESVVDMSRTDFEEGGVDLNTLDYLKSVRLLVLFYVYRLFHIDLPYTPEKGTKKVLQEDASHKMQDDRHIGCDSPTRPMWRRKRSWWDLGSV